MIFDIIIKECSFKASRSSGKGGQHVNKVSSKVELSFNISESEGLNQAEKELILSKLENRLTKEGEIIIRSEASRSQHKNKDNCISKLKKMLESALIREKRRKRTSIPRAVKEKILKDKKKRAETKEMRRKPEV